MARRNSLFWATLVLAGLTYRWTCAPGVLWQDSGTFQYRVWHNELRGYQGLALAHPLYIVVAKIFSLFPWGNHAFRVNLFSGLSAAVALAVLGDLLLSLTRSVWAAVVGVIVLGVSHTFWKHAVIAEVLSFYGLGLVVELWLLERFFSRREARWFALAILANGLNTSNHMLASLHLPVYAGIVVWGVARERLHLRHVMPCFVAYVVGLSPYLWLMVYDLVGGRSLKGTILSALFGDVFKNEVLNATLTLNQLLRVVEYFVLNFPTPLALAAPWGLLNAYRDARTRWFAWVGGAVFGIGFIFAYRYPVADQYVFFFPCYILFAVFVAMALSRLTKGSTARGAACAAFALVPIVAYEVAPGALRRLPIAPPFRQDIPFRDAYTYYVRPRMNDETSAERFARAALAQAAPDGLLIADFNVKTAITYMRDVQGVHRGVTLNLPSDVRLAPPMVDLTPDAIAPFAANGVAYINTNNPIYVPSWIIRDFDLEPAGPIFRMRPRSGAANSR